MINLKNLLNNLFIKNDKYRPLYKYLFKYKSWIKVSILLSVLNSVIQIPFPIITKIIIDEIILLKKTHLIFPLVVAILSIIPIMIAIPWIYRFFLFRLTHKTGIMIRKALMQHLFYLDLSYFKKNGPGYFASRVFDDVDKMVGSIYQVLFPILQNFFLFIIGWVLTFYINWRLALIPAIFFPIYGYANFRLSYKLRKDSSIRAEKRARTFEFFTDMFQSPETIRSHVLEKSYLRSFFNKDSDLLRQSFKVFFRKTNLETINNIMMILTPALILILGIFMIIDGTMTLGEYVAFNTFMTYMLGPLKFFFSSNVTFQDFRIALERLSNALEWQLSHEYLYNDNDAQLKSVNIKGGDIKFDSVNFSYDQKGKDSNRKENFVLKNINLEIKQGEKVVLMGKSGSGKTTLLKLIMGLYLPDTGRISIGGKSYTQLDVLRLRKKIAYVEQEPLLFKGSIGNNIMLNNEIQHNNMAEVEKAARLANAHNFIIQMENGYETPLERFGTNLSLGQKQRIAISRFFYKGSDILILDEPTSAIDLQSIELIRESLQKIPPHKTIIMVTHNPSIARFADRIILLDDAKIYGDYNSNEMTEDIISIIKNK